MNISADIVKDVIDNRKIFVEFQPIYSLNTKKVIGLEALARGKEGSEIISPYFIFQYAKVNDCVLDVDRICREKAMSAFAAESTVQTLFINFETSVLNDVVPGNGEILRTASKYSIPPSDIVIELNESNVRDTYDLLMFVDFYRSKGFLIALDNVGTGIETQNRIMLVNPDIIKIDKAIITNIKSNSYNQEVFKSVINTAKRIGAMTVAEGVETADEAITCMLLGVDYFQGYYFSKPEQFNYLFTNEARLKLEDAALSLNMSIKNNPTVVNIQIESYKRAINEFVTALSSADEKNYNELLKNYVRQHREIECAFLINSSGFQITDTVMSNESEILAGYHPAVIGVNHDIKNYFYAVKEQIEDPFISGWYISSATGKSCKTISSHFRNAKNEIIVACIDLKRR